MLRLRVVCDLVFEGIRAGIFNPDSQAKINRELLDSFVSNYGLFVLTIYNYKL